MMIRKPGSAPRGLISHKEGLGAELTGQEVVSDRDLLTLLAIVRERDNENPIFDFHSYIDKTTGKLENNAFEEFYNFINNHINIGTETIKIMCGIGKGKLYSVVKNKLEELGTRINFIINSTTDPGSSMLVVIRKNQEEK